jgi:hypothetical protein
MVNSGVVKGQQANMAQTHIAHVMDSFADTPKQQGLLPIALAEAKTAAQHAVLAVKSRSAGTSTIEDPEALGGVRRHVAHVLNAVDPTVEGKGGPGLGYGVKKAATGVAQHAELAGKSAGASATIKTEAAAVSAAANAVVKRADEIIALCKKIQTSEESWEVIQSADELVELTEQLTTGIKGEGGLQQAQQHMAMMK